MSGGTHRLRNLLHSIVLVLGMATIVSACAWTIWGGDGVIWTFIAVALAMLLSPSIPPELILSMYRARPLPPHEFPEGYELLGLLAPRADLPRTPRLYYIPSAAVNAFAVGRRSKAAIAITDGLLRMLSQRELANVFAHEITHIRNNDLWLMNLADAMSRMTSWLSYFGILLLVLNLPLMVAGAGTVPWALVLVLIAAPTLMALLQLALSRAREYEADRGAAELTRDPLGMASALEKMERRGRFWHEILLPGPRIPDPSLLRTHPKSAERVRRLVALARSAAFSGEQTEQRLRPPPRDRVHAPPRLRWPGVWY
jgi:heat shock protein HtpX